VAVSHFYPDMANRNACVSNFFLDSVTTGIVDIGKIGVVLLFLLSGYFIGGKYKNRKEFVWKRLVRLYPAYWFSVILAVVIVGGFSVQQILVNLTMLQKLFGFDNVIGLYWTLPIEISFYCVYVVFFDRFDQSRVMICVFEIMLALSFGLAVLRYITRIAVPVAYFLLMAVSMSGAILKKKREGIICKKTFNVLAVQFVVVLFFICRLAYNFATGFNETWYRYFNSYLLAFLLFILAWKINVKCSILEFIGDRSYSLYLLHPLGYKLGFALIDEDHVLLTIIVSAAMAAVLSAVSYELIEKKIYSVLEKVKEKIQN